MGKEKTCKSTLMKSWISGLAKSHHFKVEEGCNAVFCEPCMKRYRFRDKAELNQHIGTNLHNKNASRYDKRPEIQPMISFGNAPPENTFFTELCEAFLSAGIPWNKLNNPTFRGFLEKHTNRSIPDQSTIRKNYLPKVHAKVLESIRKEIGESPVWVAVDETTDSCGRYIANVLEGALIKHKPTTPYLLVSKQLEATNGATITQLVLGAFRKKYLFGTEDPLESTLNILFAAVLWPEASQEDIDKRFLLLLTDGVAYMLRAGKNLKNTYPGLIHVTCLAHALNLVAEEVRSSFKTVDKMVATVKKVFLKAPNRILKYKTMFPALALPPQPVLTRWGTWLAAVDFYAENYQNVKEVVEALDPTEAQAVCTAQETFKDPKLPQELAFISSNFTFLRFSIKKLESEALTISESLEIIDEVVAKLSKVGGITGAKLGKIKNVLGKNVGLHEIRNIKKILDGEDEGVNIALDPWKIASMKYAPLTSVDVERSFSMEKAILSDRSQSFTSQNIEKVVVCYFTLSK